MAMPYGLGTATVAGTTLKNANERDTNGIPLICRNPIKYNEEDMDVYEAPIFNHECLISILREHNKPIDDNHVITTEDIEGLKYWWEHHINPEDVSWGGKRAIGQTRRFDKIGKFYVGTKVGKVNDKINESFGRAAREEENAQGKTGTPLDSAIEGINAAANAAQSVQKALQFITDPYNLIRMIAIFGGLILLAVGSKRILSSDAAYAEGE